MILQSNMVTVHQRHLRYLMTETYKSISQINPEFMWSYFTHKDMSYNLTKIIYFWLIKNSFILLWYECYSFSRFCHME